MSVELDPVGGGGGILGVDIATLIAGGIGTAGTLLFGKQAIADAQGAFSAFNGQIKQTIGLGNWTHLNPFAYMQGSQGADVTGNNSVALIDSPNTDLNAIVLGAKSNYPGVFKSIIGSRAAKTGIGVGIGATVAGLGIGFGVPAAGQGLHQGLVDFLFGAPSGGGAPSAAQSTVTSIILLVALVGGGYLLLKESRKKA